MYADRGALHPSETALIIQSAIEEMSLLRLMVRDKLANRGFVEDTESATKLVRAVGTDELNILSQLLDDPATTADDIRAVFC